MDQHGVERSVPARVAAVLAGKGVAPSDSLLAAVSAGRDSAVLVAALAAAGFRAVTLAYLDHRIRKPHSLAADRREVRRWARRYGYRTILGSLPPGALPIHGRYESAARDARYAFLAKQLDIEGIRVLLTAHHARDSVETFLMRIIAGGGFWGGQGIPADRMLTLPSGATARVVRPLSDVEVDQITAYARDTGCSWHEDTTNADPHHLRNRIRTRVLPVLRGADSRAETALVSMLRELTAVRRDLEAVAGQVLWTRERWRIETDARSFFALPVHARIASVASEARAMTGDTSLPPFRRIAAAVEALPERPMSADIGSLTLRIDCDRVVLARRLVRPVRCGYFFCVDSYVHLEIDEAEGRVRTTTKADPQALVRLPHTAGAVHVRNVSVRDRITLGNRHRNVVRTLMTEGVTPRRSRLVPVIIDATGIRAALGSAFGGRDLIGTTLSDDGPAVACGVTVSNKEM